MTDSILTPIEGETDTLRKDVFLRLANGTCAIVNGTIPWGFGATEEAAWHDAEGELKHAHGHAEQEHEREHRYDAPSEFPSLRDWLLDQGYACKHITQEQYDRFCETGELDVA
jgi:hypothetical protein